MLSWSSQAALTKCLRWSGFTCHISGQRAVQDQVMGTFSSQMREDFLLTTPFWALLQGHSSHSLRLHPTTLSPPSAITFLVRPSMCEPWCTQMCQPQKIPFSKCILRLHGHEALRPGRSELRFGSVSSKIFHLHFTLHPVKYLQGYYAIKQVYVRNMVFNVHSLISSNCHLRG
jgi:hypothetical protein